MTVKLYEALAVAGAVEQLRSAEYGSNGTVAEAFQGKSDVENCILGKKMRLPLQYH